MSSCCKCTIETQHHRHEINIESKKLKRRRSYSAPANICLDTAPKLPKRKLPKIPSKVAAKV